MISGGRRSAVVIAVGLVMMLGVLILFSAQTLSAEETDISTTTTAEVVSGPVEISDSASATSTATTTVTIEAGVDASVTASTTVESSVSLEATTSLESVQPAISPVVTTDKEDYHPEDSMTVFGRFFAALQNIVLKIFGGSAEQDNYTEVTTTVPTDATGSFELTRQLDGTFRPLYTIVASDETGTTLTQTQVTDSLPTDFAQCSNNNSPTPAGQCNWIGSIIQQSNSTYFEGMTVPQRLLFRDFSGSGTHTITFTHQYTKGGIHAYDFLTTVNPKTGIVQGNGSFTPGTTAINACSQLSGPDLAACNAINPTVSTPVLAAIPHDSFDSKDTGPTAPGIGSTQTTKETNYETANGARNIVIYPSNSTAFSATPTVSLTHSPSGANSDTADSDVQVTITLPIASGKCTSGSKCDFLLYFGGHLAVTGNDQISDANWGPGLGSSQISGGPYHIKNVQFDGVGGSQDNQIKGADILVANNASITIIKDAVPNDPQDFGFTTTGTGLSSFSLDDDSDPTLSNTKTFSGLAPGSYSVTEAAAAGFDLTNLVCTDPTTDSSVNLGTGTATINLAAGESVTCTYTNTKRGHLIVDKVTNPSSDPTVFSINASGTGTVTGGGAGTTTDAVNKDYEVTPGTYSVTETVPAGWTQVSSTCTNVVVAAGQTQTCTITNAKLPKLTVVKIVVNDNGGTKHVSDFPLFVDGGSVTSSSTNTFSIGAHSVSETNATGYTATIGGDCDTSGNVTLAAGDNKVCTITNNDQPAKITLIKNVINNNGGTANANDFNLTIGSTTVTSGQTLDVNANTPIALNETPVSGYSFVSITGTSCPSVLGGTVTLTVGQEITCTITNDDNAPHLTLNKIVVNDNGGTASESDWTLTAAGPTPLSGPGASGSSDVVSTSTFSAGTYTLSETGSSSGYTASAWTCVGGIQVGNQITLSLGESATCSITNNDLPGTLHVIKQVVNDNGGTAVASDFSFQVNGGTTTAFESDGQNDLTVNVGTYSVTEPAVTGYATAYDNCSNVTIANGGEATCTITNDDIQPKLTVTKIVVNNNGGNAVVSDFPLFVGSTTVTSGVESGFNAGSYVVSETNQSGYTATISGDCDTSGNITLAPGDVKACTITNDDQPAKITLIKQVINNNGGTAGANDFNLTVGTTTVTSGQTREVDANTAIALNETQISGYSFVSITGTSCPSVLGGTVTLNEGQEITCTITNDDQPGHLIVHKITDPASDTTTVFSITAIGGTVQGSSTQPITGSSSVDYTVNAGTYSVTEALPSGWDVTGNTCTNIAVGNGETKECTITNTKRGSITIVKDAQPNDLKDFEFTFTGQSNFFLDDDQGVQDIGLNGDVDRPQSQTFNNLVPGTQYTVTELVPPTGWKLDTPLVCTGQSAVAQITNGVTITLIPGDSVTCTFVNEKTSPTRTQGFWKNHTAFTGAVFASVPLNGSMLIGNGTTHKGPVDTAAKIFGAYFADIAKTSAGGKRTAIDKARIQLLRQLVTAKLNCAAFGCPAAMTSIITTADANYAGNSESAMLASAAALDAYNNSGDTIIISPPLPVPGQATPKTSESTANTAFWNTP